MYYSSSSESALQKFESVSGTRIMFDGGKMLNAPVQEPPPNTSAKHFAVRRSRARWRHSRADPNSRRQLVKVKVAHAHVAGHGCFRFRCAPAFDRLLGAYMVKGVGELWGRKAEAVVRAC